MGFTSSVTRMYDSIFANGDDAEWRVGGVGSPIIIKVRQQLPDVATGFGGGASVKQRSSIFEARVSEAPTLANGDTLTIGGQAYKVAQANHSDPRRLIWRIQATVAT